MLKFIILTFFCISTLFSSEILIVGIAGGTGSGKTTLAKKIQDAFPEQSVLISQDSYYKDLSSLSIRDREKTNFDHPDSLDFELLKTHIVALKKGQAVDLPVYSFRTHTRETSTQRVAPNQLIIVEGILLFAVPKVRDLFDIKLFVDTDDDVRLLRRIERDIHERSRSLTSVRDQYLATVKPMHDAFVEPSKQHADLIVPQGGENVTALSLIISKLREEVNAKNRIALSP